MNRKLPIICASIDTFISIIIVVTIAAFDGKAPIDLLTRYRGFFIIVLMISLVAGWRGYIDSSKILAGDRSWLRPARDGFIIGFIPVPVTHSFGILQEALASGPAWPTIGYSSVDDWIKYIIWMLGGAILFGGIGAIYGLSLSALNRIIIRISRQ